MFTSDGLLVILLSIKRSQKRKILQNFVFFTIEKKTYSQTHTHERNIYPEKKRIIK